MSRAEIFSKWLHRQGYSVIKTSSSYWYDASPRVYQAFPYHLLIQPSDEELLNLLRKNHGIALRYSLPAEIPRGFISYHTVYDNSEYTIDGLDRRSRQNIRKGLKNCKIEKVSFNRLAEEGWQLETDTANRQGRKLTIKKEDWHRRYTAADDLDGFEAWGAIVNGRLVASLFTFQYENCCEMISQQCHRDYLKFRVNNALCYVVTEKMVKRNGINSIFYSLQSLDAPDSVDQFKFRMGYTAKPVRQHVIFHPLIESICNRATYYFVDRMSERRPEVSFLSKMRGMMKFYLEGNFQVENPIH